MHLKFNFLKVALLQSGLRLAFTRELIKKRSYLANQRIPAPAVFLDSIKFTSCANDANASVVYF